MNAVTTYPIFYGTRRVTLDILRATFTPNMHPEMVRRVFPWIESQGGHIGIGGGYRPPGTQPDRPGFAKPGDSFHEGQQFPSGRWYCALDLVATNPGAVHRSPRWSEVPPEGSDWARRSGVHCNIPTEAWHMQPIPLDGFARWRDGGRLDLDHFYPIPTTPPTPTYPPVPPLPTLPPTNTQGFTMDVRSRYLILGSAGSDVRFYQRIMNDIAGQGLTLDGQYGAATVTAVRNWQGFFGLTVDGQLGPKTQASMIEIALGTS